MSPFVLENSFRKYMLSFCTTFLRNTFLYLQNLLLYVIFWTQIVGTSCWISSNITSNMDITDNFSFAIFTQIFITSENTTSMRCELYSLCNESKWKIMQLEFNKWSKDMLTFGKSIWNASFLQIPDGIFLFYIVIELFHISVIGLVKLSMWVAESTHQII